MKHEKEFNEWFDNSCCICIDKCSCEARSVYKRVWEECEKTVIDFYEKRCCANCGGKDDCDTRKQIAEAIKEYKNCVKLDNYDFMCCREWNE